MRGLQTSMMGRSAQGVALLGFQITICSQLSIKKVMRVLRKSGKMREGLSSIRQLAFGMSL